MRVDDLNHEDLLGLDPEGGIIRFAGQRALLLDALAMGLLRKQLAESFGFIAARAVLTQFGFAHGWRMAGAMKDEFSWDTPAAWRDAGMRIHALEGLFLIEAGNGDPQSKRGATLAASYEAEQHLLHFGRADEPVCWTISGLISGYISRTTGTEMYVLEDRCLGRGDACCHLMARTRAEWGDQRAHELRFFEPGRLQECLDVSLKQLTQTLKLAERKLVARSRELRRVVPDEEVPLGAVANSTGMMQLLRLARQVAKVDSTLLITGESGTGKERIARLVHDESARVAGPFIAVNCGAIPETLLESELFGHRRGAFTGATSDRLGLFEAAHGGTLLLDEIGDVSASMQVKLLRVLQERQVRRVGENSTRDIDVRVLAATNRDLKQDVETGRFRQDLYYRLKVVELHVPALRHRPEDVLPLARMLLAEAGARMNRPMSALTPGAADRLQSYAWPGNVRELENAMERAVALSRADRVELEDLPQEVRAGPLPGVANIDDVRPLAEMEKQYILAVLALNGGNQTKAAKQLQIGAATLYRKLKRYGLTRSRTSEAPRANHAPNLSHENRTGRTSEQVDVLGG